MCGEAAHYLLGCHEDWACESDTWHETLDGALAQAEHEYEGTRRTWITPPAAE